MGDANLGRAVLEISTKDINLAKGLAKSESDVKAWISRQEAQFQKFGQTMSKSLDDGASKSSSAISKLESSSTRGASGLKTLENAVISNAGALKNTASAAAQAESKFASMSTSLAGGAKGMGQLNNTVSSLVPGLNLGAVGFAGIGIAALKSAGDFERSMANLQIMTGITDKSSVAFKQLEATAISVGESTTFSSKEAADGMAELAASGLTAQQTIAAIGPVAKVAEINQVSMAEAANTATTAMNAFGLSANDVSKIIDIQTTAANMGVLKFQGFQQAIANVGSVAKLSNQSLEGMTAALISLTNNGQSAADAGTSIKSALLSLTNPSDEAAGAMKQLGLNIFDAQGKMRPFAEIVRQIENNTKNMTDAQRNQLLATLAGSDGIRAFAGALGTTVKVQRDGQEVTLKGADALEEFQRQLDNSAGAADKAAAVIHSTFNAQLEELGGQVEEMVRKLGSEFLPVAKETIKVLETKIESPSSWFKDWKGLIPMLASTTTDASIKVADGFTQMGSAVKNSRGQIVAYLADGQTLETWAKEHNVTVAGSVEQQKALAAATDTTSKTVVSQSAAFKANIQDNIATRQALLESAKAADLYQKKIEQGYAQAEFSRKKMLDLNAAIDYNGLSFAKLSGPMQTIANKYNAVTGQINTLTIAMDGLAKKNDELSGKISANNQILSIAQMGIEQASLKYKDATFTFDGTKHSLGETFDAWQDLIKVQDAGGKGSYEAGKKAGELANQLKSLDGGALAPLVDTIYNATHGNNDYTKSLVENTTAASKTQVQVDKLTESQRKTDTAFEEAATKARGNANAMGVVAQAAGLTGSKFNDSASAIDNSKKRLGEWNAMPAVPKKPESNFALIALAIGAAVSALNEWNNKPVVNKTGTMTWLNTAVNAASPAPSGGGGGSGPIASPSRGQSAGLFGTLSSFDRFGGGSASALAAATQQAANTAFSLTGLQSQIDQIVKMFNSMDAKAIKAASDQAENVKKIADGAGAMLDAFTKMKEYTGTSKDIMKLVAADSAAMTGFYIEGAKQFNQKQLEGAALYVETSGKVASAASSMFDALAKLPKYSGPSRENIRDFTGNVKDLTFDFWDYSRVFSKDMLEAASTYAETAGKVAVATGQGADALLKLKDWPPIFRGSISGFVGNLKDATFDFSEVTIFSEDQYKSAVTFAENSGKVSDAIGKGADALAKLEDWPPIFRGSISGFTGNLKDAVFDFDEAGKNFDETMYKRATDFAETGGKVGAAIGQGVAGLSSLAEYKGAIRSQITLFAADLDATVDIFQTFALRYQTDGLKAAGLYAETAGKVTGVIKGGVEGFNGLAEYKGVAQGKLTQFEADIDQLLKDFTTIAATYEPKALEAGKAWGDSVGGITNGLADSIKLFEGLQQYKSVPSKTITLFINDVELTVQLAGKMAQRAEGPLLDQLKLFTTATGGLFSELSGAMGLFQSLDKYKSVPVKVIQDFLWQIELTIQEASKLADRTDTDMLQKVDDYSKAIGDIFDRFKKASDVFSDIEKFKDDPAHMINTMMVGVKTAIDLMPGAKNQADEFYKKIDAWAGELELAARRAQEGLAAANTAVSTVTGGAGGQSFDNWQPSVGAATQALSSSASTPLLSSGLSMPAPVVTSTNQSSSSQDTYQLIFPNVTNVTRADVKDIAEAVFEKQIEKARR